MLPGRAPGVLGGGQSRSKVVPEPQGWGCFRVPAPPPKAKRHPSSPAAPPSPCDCGPPMAFPTPGPPCGLSRGAVPGLLPPRLPWEHSVGTWERAQAPVWAPRDRQQLCQSRPLFLLPWGRCTCPIRGAPACAPPGGSQPGLGGVRSPVRHHLTGTHRCDPASPPFSSWWQD